MTLAIRLDAKLEKRLGKLAKETGRTKAFYVRRALEEYMEDMEDLHIALSRLESPPKRYLSMEEVEAALDLDGNMGPKGAKKPAKTRSSRAESHPRLPA